MVGAPHRFGDLAVRVTLITRQLKQAGNAFGHAATLATTAAGFRVRSIAGASIISAGLGVLAAALALRSAEVNQVGLDSILLEARFGNILFCAAAILSVFWTSVRICYDHESGWLSVAVARGMPRPVYAAAVLLTHSSFAALLVFMAAAGNWAVGRVSGHAIVLQPSLLSIVWASFGWGAYALVCSVMIRRHSLTMLVLIVLTFTPLLLMLLALIDLSHLGAPQYLRWVLLSHLPPFPGAPLAHHAAYFMSATFLSLVLSHRSLGKYE